MAIPALNPLLSRPPLLGLDGIPGAELDTVADPFPVTHGGRLYLLAEVQGRRPATGPFKKIGVFRVADGLDRVEWLGEACPEDDGLCSFPFVLRDGDRYLLVPEVFVPMQGGGPAILQTLQIWTTRVDDFPFGWTKHHEGVLPGCAAPSDKVLIKDDATFWLFCSDNAMQRLLAYTTEDLRRFRPHPANPIATAPGPWRLGGGPFRIDGEVALPLQHRHDGSGYGGGVTALRLLARDAERVQASLDPGPLLAAERGRDWMSHGAHHVALVRHAGRVIAATDGSDGRHWRSTVVDAGGVPSLGPLA